MAGVRRLIVGGLLAASLLVVPVTPAAAETTVAHNGSIITITVKVDVYGAEGLTGPDGTTPLIDYWEGIVNDTWGAAFGTIPYKNCYVFKLKLDLEARSRDREDREGRHRLHVTAPRSGGDWDGVGWNGVPETSRDASTGDGTRSLENNRGGTVPANVPATVVAHEFGHLFGLGDDRADGAPEDGRNGTMMVGGVEGVDVNVVQNIDKNLIDRIGKIIERYLKDKNKKPLPKCQTWKGPIKGALTTPGCSPTNPSVEGELEVGVVRNQVVGTGSWVEQAFSCGGTTAGPFELSFPITGTKTDDQFNLDLGSDALSMTIVDSTASGSFEVFGAGGYGSNLTFTLECQKNCDEEAVG